MYPDILTINILICCEGIYESWKKLFCPWNIHLEVNIVKIGWTEAELWKLLIRLFAIHHSPHFENGLAEAMYPHIFTFNQLICDEDANLR